MLFSGDENVRAALSEKRDVLMANYVAQRDSLLGDLLPEVRVNIRCNKPDITHPEPPPKSQPSAQGLPPPRSSAAENGWRAWGELRHLHTCHFRSNIKRSCACTHDGPQ